MRTAPRTDSPATTDPLLGLTHRVGDHLKSAVEYVRIGPVGMMFLPGEVPGELTIGLPALFRSMPEKWYEEPPGTHAFGDDYQVPGYAQRRMSDRYEWMVGLGSDQIGYFVPLSNYRVALRRRPARPAPGACAATVRGRSHRVPGRGRRRHLQAHHR